MNLVDSIEGHFQHPLLRQTHEAYLKVWKKDTRFPFFNYMGVNFDDQGVRSVKFYFHVFRRITTEEAMLFLPAVDDFNEYYAHYEESLSQNLNHSGCAFEVKFVRGQENPAQGFHFRFSPNAESYKILGMPARLPFTDFENWLGPGINFEYYGDQVLRKTYFYFIDSFHKAYFSEKYELPFLSEAELIEYSEASDFSKINSWYGRSEQQAKVANILSKEENEAIEQLCEKYQMRPKAYGFYEGLKVKAVYLMGLKDIHLLHDEVKDGPNDLLKRITSGI